LAIALLLLLALPWYREAGRAPAIWFGLPDWLVVAALCFLGIAALNAVAWWRADWDDETLEGD
jgi:protein-S-isoprenylcysteine O-methyltransferase Ste14